VPFQLMMYDMVLVGLKADLLSNFKPFTQENGKFSSIDKSVDQVADVETNPENCPTHQ